MLSSLCRFWTYLQSTENGHYAVFGLTYRKLYVPAGNSLEINGEAWVANTPQGDEEQTYELRLLLSNDEHAVHPETRTVKASELPDERPLKSFYTDMANTLITLSTFAGGLVIATQFIITCRRSRVEALLALASQLFLGTPLCLMSVHLLLYGMKDEAEVRYESQTHALVCCQFTVSGIMLCAAFIILGVAIFAAEEDGKELGICGIVLLSLFLLVAVGAGLVKTGLWKFGPAEHSNRIIWPSVWRFVPLFLVQMTAFGILLGYGAHAANSASIQNGCGVENQK